MVTEFYITFGVKYRREVHPQVPEISPYGWAVIEARNEAEARRIAHAVFDDNWGFMHDSLEDLEPEHYPLGEIYRISQKAPMPSAFVDLPASDFPMRLEFFKVDGGEVVHTIDVDGPGAIHVPSLTHHGRTDVRIYHLGADASADQQSQEAEDDTSSK